MACCMVELDKRPGVRPMGIWETLYWDLAKLVMREAGYQVKPACGNLHMCTVLDAGIEGAPDIMGQSGLERVRQRRSAEE